MAQKDLEMPGSDSGSEWEYEYHPSETETFYVTLDLSSAEPSRNKPKDKTVPAENASSAQDLRVQAVQVRSTPTAPSALVPNPSVPPTLKQDELKVMDLQTSNPLVLYRGQSYSCTWADTLGTDLILCAPDLEVPDEPIIAGDGFWILSKSTIKLMAQESKLDNRTSQAIWRRELEASQGKDPSTSTKPPSQMAPQDLSSHSTSKLRAASNVLSIDEYTKTPAARDAQMRFLELFAAAKKARGERDEALVLQPHLRGQSTTDVPANNDAQGAMYAAGTPTRGSNHSTSNIEPTVVDIHEALLLEPHLHGQSTTDAQVNDDAQDAVRNTDTPAQEPQRSMPIIEAMALDLDASTSTREPVPSIPITQTSDMDIDAIAPASLADGHPVEEPELAHTRYSIQELEVANPKSPNRKRSAQTESPDPLSGIPSTSETATNPLNDASIHDTTPPASSRGRARGGVRGRSRAGNRGRGRGRGKVRGRGRGRGSETSFLNTTAATPDADPSSSSLSFTNIPTTTSAAAPPHTFPSSATPNSRVTNTDTPPATATAPSTEDHLVINVLRKK